MATQNWATPANGASATASSVYTFTPSNSADNAIDGLTDIYGSATSWESLRADPQWLQIDLGQTRRVSQVVIRWDSAARATSYEIQTSDDGSTWTTRWSTTTGSGATDTDNFTEVTCRYVRMYGTARNSVYSYFIAEMYVYGDDAPLTTTLTVADSAHAHAADSPTLTQHHVLVVADSTHGHTADGVVLTQHHVLVVADALHAHTADSPALTQHHALTVADAAHAHAAGSPTLTQHHILTVADAAHAHAADSPTLTYHPPGAATLTVADALHGHTAGTIALTQHHTLTVADAAHAHAADTPTLTAYLPSAVALTVADAAHAHTADSPTLTQHHTLSVQDAHHAMTSDHVVWVFVYRGRARAYSSARPTATATSRARPGATAVSPY